VLPSEIIGNIASFLQQRSYAFLSRISRAAFLGRNAPNRLQELDLEWLLEKSSSDINLLAFPQIRHLYIGTDCFKTNWIASLASNSERVFNRLRELSMFYDVINLNVMNFLTCDVINFDRVNRWSQYNHWRAHIFTNAVQVRRH
jgi:hypothetical protein